MIEGKGYSAFFLCFPHSTPLSVCSFSEVTLSNLSHAKLANGDDYDVKVESVLNKSVERDFLAR